MIRDLWLVIRRVVHGGGVTVLRRRSQKLRAGKALRLLREQGLDRVGLKFCYRSDVTQEVVREAMIGRI